MEPRGIITDKEVYHVGDTIDIKVKCICGILDDGVVEFWVYKSSDRLNWEVVSKKSTVLSCPVGGGYLNIDCDPLVVTQDMTGMFYIGVCNRWPYPWSCLDSVNSDTNVGMISYTKNLTVKNAYPVGYGGITITTVPSGSNIDINGQPMGLTPISDEEIPAGAYTVTIYKNGYISRNDTVIITEGNQTVKNYTLTSNCAGWWCPLIDYAPYIIGGAAGVIALVLIMKARQKKMERKR